MNEQHPEERRRTPRRRLRDRIASLDRSQHPALAGHHELQNHLLLVDDDLRQTALQLGAVEQYLHRSLELIESESTGADELGAHADDDAVLERMELLLESLANLKRRMKSIAVGLSVKSAIR
jgi:hypothetical protein